MADASQKRKENECIRGTGNLIRFKPSYDYRGWSSGRLSMIYFSRNAFHTPSRVQYYSRKSKTISCGTHHRDTEVHRIRNLFLRVKEDYRRILFVLHSICITFDHCTKSASAWERKQKLCYLFCFPLTYSYFCT